MIWIAFSAGFVGFVHTLTPAHWLPVVLVVQSRGWPLKMAALAGLVTAAGHCLFSLILSLISLGVGASLLVRFECQLEQYAGLGLAVFGLLYAGLSFFRHVGCSVHSHHPIQLQGVDWDVGKPPPEIVSHQTPFYLLFSIGFSPCVAVLPVFAAAASEGIASVVLSFCSFCLGVVLALVGITVLVCYGFLKLNYPLFERFFEHYGDAITGLGIAGIGILLFLLPHS